MASAEEVRAACESAFAAPDGILEANAVASILRFMKAGGAPQDVVRLLSDSYRGYALMGNLMSSWLDVLDTGDGGAAGSPRNAAAAACVNAHLRQRVRETFRPSLADAIWESGSEPPVWLNELVSQPTWRPLLCELAEEHPNCLLLNYVVQRMAEAGHDSEIMNVASAANNLEVFRRVLSEALGRLFAATSEGARSSAVASICKMACHDQYTYAYVQSVLLSVVKRREQNERWQIAEHLSEVVRAYARRRNPGAATLDLIMLRSVVRCPDNVLHAIAGMVTERSLNPADVRLIYRHCKGGGEFGARLPAEVVQAPELLELLIQDIFSPARKINPSFRGMYVYVLAYASAGEWATGGGGQQQQPQPQQLVDEALLQATIRALEAAYEIVEQASLASVSAQSLLDVCQHAERYPVVAAGLVHWISICFEDPNHFDGFGKEVGGLGHTVFSASVSAAATTTAAAAAAAAVPGEPATAGGAEAGGKQGVGPVPFRVALLCDVAEHHLLLRPRVMEVLVAALEREYTLDALLALDLRRVLMSGLVFLVCLGTHAFVVISYVRSRLEAKQIDVSLARHGVTEMLRLLTPPFTREFASEVVRILENEAILEGLRGDDKDHRELVAAFVASCRGLVPISDAVSAAVGP